MSAMANPRKYLGQILLSLWFVVFYSSAFSQTANVTTGCAPLQVNFTAPSGSTTYFWDFDNGASSNVQNPSNTFVTAGTYDVEFSESVGGPVIGSITIEVFATPIPQFTTSTPLQGCSPLTIDLSADVTLPPGIFVNTYTWTSGLGTGGSSQNVSFTYPNPGIYTVTLGITTNSPSCDNTSTFTNLVGVSNPIADFLTNPNPAISCTAPLDVVFTNSSSSTIPLTYDWDFGNGNTSTSGTPPSQSYTTVGNYTATLTITDTNNCVKTISKPITVGQPEASFDMPDTVCINTLVNFQNTSSAGNYVWNFGPSAAPPVSVNTSPNVTFSAAGNVSVSMTVTAPGGLCSDDTLRTIFIEDPVLSIISIPSPQCDTNAVFTYSVVTTSNIINYTWIFDDGDSSIIANPTHTYHIADTAYAERDDVILTGTLIAETSGGCLITQQFVDTVYLVYARFMPYVAQGCAPLTVVFSDSSHSEFNITDYFYDYGDGSTMNYTSNLPSSHIFTTAGEYPVVMTATNNLGCTDISDTIWIVVGDVLPLDFTASQTTICPGEEITFTNTSANQSLVDGWNYSSNGDLLSGCADDPNGTFVFDDTVGVFDITLSAYYNGCLSTVTLSNLITVNGPIAKFNYLYQCSDTMDLQLINQSMGYTDVQWEFGDGNTSSAVDTTYTYSNSGTYEVILTATSSTSGCPPSADTAEIQIRQIEANFSAGPFYCGNVPNDFDGSLSTDVFEDCYTGYKWIFSDSTMRPITTSNPNEAIQFENSGEQSLSLVVTDFNGCTDTITHTFAVYNLEADYLLTDAMICTPDTLTFTSLSVADTTLVSWSWDFDDGNSSSSEDTSYAYSDTPPSPYNITLTVTDALGCKDSIGHLLSFYTPTSVISANPFLGHTCTDIPIQFSATDFTSQGSNLTFNWDFGDGSVAPGQNVSHSYSSETSTNVKLYFTENATGCMDSTIYAVDIQAYPVADFNSDVDNLAALCSPQAITFNDQSISSSPVVSTNWTFSNGMNSSAPNPVFVFVSGSYTTGIIVQTSYGCSDTLIKSFEVINPSADFTLSPSVICLGDEIVFTLFDTVDVYNYSWDFGDGTFINDVTPVAHNYTFFPPSGQTIANLTVSGPGGVCPSTVEQEVFIHDVKALFDRNDEIDTTICLGDLLTITNNSLNADDYQWNFGDTTIGVNGPGSFTHEYLVADTFSIDLMIYNSQYGCRDTITKDVIVFDNPDISAFGDTVCFGDLANIYVDGNQPTHAYSWSPSGTLNNGAIYNPTADLAESTTFTVVVTDGVTDCSSSDSAEVIVIQPLANIYFDTTVVVGDIATLPVDNQNGYVNFIWTPDTGLSCLDCPNPEHQGLTEITYTLQMEDSQGCFTADGVFNIHILPETFIDVPTTFS